MRFALLSCMRDEGPFLLEWVAYHLTLGFEGIVIASNDCRDGSDLLLARLAEAGVITHLPHQPPYGVSAQESGIATAFAHLSDAPPEWLLHIDCDEYLWLEDGESLDSLTSRAGSADVVALPWRLYGDGGHSRWPGATLPHFTRCAPLPRPEHDKFKSLFRFASFGGAHDHMPTQARVAEPVVVSPAGNLLENAPLLSTRHHARYRPLAVSLEPGPARINHYAVRSSDVFCAKEARGDGQGKDASKYRLGSRWHRIANCNDEEDRSILSRWPETDAMLSQLRALPGIADAEAAALAWHFPQSEGRHVA